jgi:phosphatidylserine synthase
VMYVVHSKPIVNLAIVVILSALTCMNVNVPHPVRVQYMRHLTLPVLMLWLGAMLGLTLAYPTAPLWARGIELGGVAYFVWLSVRRTLRGVPDELAIPTVPDDLGDLDVSV